MCNQVDNTSATSPLAMNAAISAHLQVLLLHVQQRIKIPAFTPAKPYVAADDYGVVISYSLQ